MRRMVLIVIATLLLMAAISACVFVLPNYIVERDFAGVQPNAKRLTQAEFLKSKNDIRTTLLQGLGALLLLAGASIGAVASFRQLQINREGQITDRFTKAVDQLGNKESLDVRLGGIYSLGQIAESSSSQLEPVMELLSAFIEENSPWPPVHDADYPENFPNSDLPPLRYRAPDVQAALNVLGSFSASKTRKEISPRLISADLRRAKIGGNFYGAYFSGSNLTRAVFFRPDIREGSFYNTNLEETDGFESCRLKGSIAGRETKWPEGFDPSSHGIRTISPAAGAATFGRRIRKGGQHQPE